MALLTKIQTAFGQYFPLMNKGRDAYLLTQDDLDHSLQCIETINLTSAQILALNTTPVQLVAAPGAGKYIVVDEIVVKISFLTAAYTGANNLEFRYTDGSGVKVAGDVAAACLNVASGSRVDVAVGVAEAIAAANAAVVAVVPTANPAAGSGTGKIIIRYHVVTI